MSPAPKTNFIYLWRDQDTSKHIRKYVHTSWKKYYLWKYETQEIRKQKKTGHVCTQLFELLKFGNYEILNFLGMKMIIY